MILIADAGSTKVDWCAIGPDGSPRMFTSEGINALMLNEDELHTRISTALSEIGHIPRSIYYYGAGCVDSGVIDKVRRAFRSSMIELGTKPEMVEVNSDLLGAARALCGHKPGLVAILGTGSNTCYYDGQKVADHIPSLGFILGDEGSGSAIGKRVINAAYKRLIPDSVRKELETFTGMTYGQIVRHVYRSHGINTWLASLVPFIRKQIPVHPEVRGIVADEFRLFFKRNIKPYGQLADSVPIHFTGGVAAAFSDVLSQTAAMLGFTNMGMIEAKPMDGLIRFHTSSLK